MRGLSIISAILILTSFFSNGKCQEAVHEFTESFSYGTSDPLGHFYLVKENQLRKIDTLSSTLYTYSNSGLGEISSVDTSDPFRILLYYKSFNQVLFLDRSLSTIGDPIKLDELDIFTITGICRAKQGGFWLINSNDNSLVHLDNNLKVRTSIHLSIPNSGAEDQWFPMLEWKEGLYICLPDKKVMKFDLFGKLIRSIPLKVSTIQVKENNLILSGAQGVFLYQDSPYDISGPLKLKLPQWEHLVISKDFAMIKRDSGWMMYRIKKTP